MPRVQTIPAKGEILRWARLTAGFNASDAARRLGLTLTDLTAIEDGEQGVTSRIFHAMMGLYKQVESVLLLPQVPKRDPLPEDFRTSGSAPLSLSPEARIAIREARRIQRFVTELRDIDREIMPLAAIPTASLDDPVEQLSKQERLHFGVTIEQQRKWRSDDAFENWRDRAQRLGILVLLKKMPWRDCRGLALWDARYVPAIVVNSEDRANARTFTLFHEYAHLMLKQPGVCLQNDRGGSIKERVERWCNSYAAEFLVPAGELHRIVQEKYQSLGLSDWTISEIQRVAALFKVSRYVAARRLKDLEISNFYDTNHEQLRLYDKRPTRDSGGVSRPSGWQVTQKLSEIGQGAASIILDGVRGQIADASDAADLLGLPIDQLRELDKKVATPRTA